MRYRRVFGDRELLLFLCKIGYFFRCCVIDGYGFFSLVSFSSIFVLVILVVKVGVVGRGVRVVNFYFRLVFFGSCVFSVGLMGVNLFVIFLIFKFGLICL